MTTVFTDGTIILADRRTSSPGGSRDRHGKTKKVNAAHDMTSKINLLKLPIKFNKDVLHPVCISAGDVHAFKSLITNMNNSGDLNSAMMTMALNRHISQREPAAFTMLMFAEQRGADLVSLITHTVIKIEFHEDAVNPFKITRFPVGGEGPAFHAIGSGSTLYKWVHKQGRLPKEKMAMVEVFQASIYLDVGSGPTYSMYNLATKQYIEVIRPKPGVLMASAKKFMASINLDLPEKPEQIYHGNIVP